MSYTYTKTVSKCCGADVGLGSALTLAHYRAMKGEFTLEEIPQPEVQGYVCLECGKAAKDNKVRITKEG